MCPKRQRRAWIHSLALSLLVLKLHRASAFIQSARLGTDIWRHSGRRRDTARSDALGESSSSSTVIEYDDFLPQPNTEWDALQVTQACMGVLLERKDAGLEVCFNFSSDRCRAALGGSLDRFAEYATNPIFGFLVNCRSYEIVNVGPVIAGTTTRGAMQTVLMDALQEGEGTEEKDARRFLWTLQMERRPPRQDCWTIHEVIYVKNAFQLTI